MGVQTPALPLALWVLGAIGAGIVTNLLITSLFSLSNHFAVRAARSQWRQSRQSGFQARSGSPSPAASRTATARTTDDDAAWNNWDGYEASRQSSATAVDNDPIDDWEAEPNDDWDADEPSGAFVDARAASSRRTDYEARQEPKTTSRSGSVYSYSYKEPNDSGVGKAEPVIDKPVVDADYRVIVPPHRSLDEEPAAAEPTATDSADDWFEEDGSTSGDRRSRRN